MKSVFLALAVVAVSQLELDAQQPILACEASPVIRAAAPADPSADPVTGHWYINTDRSIWVGVPADGWPAGGLVYRGRRPIKGQKTYWVRPQGTVLRITGRRLDAEAAGVDADVPCCYGSGFQIVALHFPTEGCWEVNATSGDRELRFVTMVRPPVTPRGR
jgi:hypothetical protein